MSENRRPEGWESTCRTFSWHAGRASPGPTPSISAHVLAAFALLDQFAGVWISKSKRRNEASNFLGKICILSLP